MKLGCIGAGNMAGAILTGWSRTKGSDQEAGVCDVYPEKARALSDALALRFCKDAEEIIRWADVLLLAIKPQNAADFFSRHYALLEDKALLSIVTGWDKAKIAAHAPASLRVLCIMPNTPALVGKGMTAFVRSHSLRDAEFALARALFESVGVVELVEEKQLGAVIGISGSSPAYTYLYIEALADAGVALGLPRDVAQRMAAQAVAGAGEMVLQTGDHPGALKDAVCSPGGTTIEAIRSLEKNGFRSAAMEAAIASAEKAARL